MQQRAAAGIPDGDALAAPADQQPGAIRGPGGMDVFLAFYLQDGFTCLYVEDRQEAGRGSDCQPAAIRAESKRCGDILEGPEPDLLLRAGVEKINPQRRNNPQPMAIR